jgi:hypothetical protein
MDECTPLVGGGSGGAAAARAAAAHHGGRAQAGAPCAPGCHLTLPPPFTTESHRTVHRMIDPRLLSQRQPMTRTASFTWP